VPAVSLGRDLPPNPVAINDDILNLPPLPMFNKLVRVLRQKWFDENQKHFPACTRSSSSHSQVLRDTFGLSACLLTSAQSKLLTPDVYRLQESRFCPSICLACPLEMLTLQSLAKSASALNTSIIPMHPRATPPIVSHARQASFVLRYQASRLTPRLRHTLA
jgi:hypothetical protein